MKIHHNGINNINFSSNNNAKSKYVNLQRKRDKCSLYPIICDKKNSKTFKDNYTNIKVRPSKTVWLIIACYKQIEFKRPHQFRP